MSQPRNEEHFLTILESHKGILYKVAHAYGKSPEAVRDLVQDIILQLWRSFPTYDDRYAYTTWMYRIALNVCISSYRYERRRAGINQPWTDDVLQLRDMAEMEMFREQVQQLYSAIQTLKELDRALILLYLEGLTQQEMGGILGLTLTNVSSRIHRIKQQLRKQLSKL